MSAYQLLAILQAAADEAALPRIQSCPNDGTPYVSDGHGELRCPFDGHRPPDEWTDEIGNYRYAG